MDTAIDILKIIIGFVLLIKGADFFVEGASAVAAKLGVPELVIGLTIVAIGTSAPEAAVSISAALKGNNGISIGNVVGSNIMNILVILGLTAVITTLTVKKSVIKVDIPVMIASTIAMILWGMLGGKLSKFTGVVFLVTLIVYMVYLVSYARRSGADDDAEEVKDIKNWLIPIFILGGVAAIILGSNVAVEGASGIAKTFGVSDRVIGLTIVAFGTSLPELVTSVTAARKGHADIAIGNIVGSNLFNILFILGMTSLIIDLPYLSEGANFVIDGFVMLAAALLLYILVLPKKKLTRAGGIIMLLGYSGYFLYLLMV
ncbi:MAG: calcium/sodium antiporter [Eubacterium sp.]|nr:calcium/sodium antiporter [Eubacterium sp.]